MRATLDEAGRRIRRAIEERLGHFPVFFEPALASPEVLRSLWQSTLSAYLHNPLPAGFKERLFARLSRHCALPGTLHHSCPLRALETMGPQEVLALAGKPPPRTDGDVGRDLGTLSSLHLPLVCWPKPGSEVERALLRCCELLFAHAGAAPRCRNLLRVLLGPSHYEHLVAFLAYVRTCHTWLETHPETAASADLQVQQHLEAGVEGLQQLRLGRSTGNRAVDTDRMAAVLESHRLVVEALQKSEESYRQLSAHSLNGFARHEVVTDREGRPIDYLFLEVNPAFEELTGLSAEEVLGQRATQVLPRAECAVLLGIYGRVALTGEPVRCEHYTSSADRYYDITAFRPRPGQFAVLFSDVSGCRRVERAIRESEERFRAMVQSSPDAIVIADGAGAVVCWNRSACQLFGYEEAEIAGRPLTSLMPERYREAHQSAWTRMQLGGGRVGPGPTRELYGLHKDGSEFPLELTASAWQEGGNLFVGAIIRDISERQRVEEQMRRTQEQLERVLEASPAVVYALRIEGEALVPSWVSANVTRMTGYELEEALHPAWWAAHLHPEDREPALARIPTLFTEGRLVHEYRFRCKDEAFRWIRDELGLVRDAGGRPTEVVGSWVDVTERKHADEALRESEEQFRTLAEQSPTMIFINQGGRMVYANKACEEETGYTREEICSPAFDVRCLIAPEWGELMEANYRRLLQGGESPPYELQLLTRDGRLLDAMVTARLISYRGRPALLGSIVDITERVRTEMELERRARRLEILHRIDMGILAARSPEEIAQQTMAALRDLIPCQRAVVAAFDLSAGEARMLAVDGEAVPALEPGATLPLASYPPVDLLASYPVYYLPDLAEEDDLAPVQTMLLAHGFRSVVTVPLLSDGICMGLVRLVARDPGAFEFDHLDIAREVGVQLAVALHQANTRAGWETERGRLMAAIENFPDGVVLLDGEQTPVMANSMARCWLAEAGEVTPAGKLRAFGQRSLEDLLAPPAEAPGYHEVEIAGPAPRVFELEARPMRADGPAPGWVVVLRDATQERRVQARLETQQRLAAVGQLAAGIAHDFRNILQGILGFSQLAQRRDDLPDGLAGHLHRIHQGGQRAVQLIQQILDFSRQSTSRQEPIDLTYTVDDILQLLQRTVPESIETVLVVEPGPCWVRADIAQLQQVVANLIINACDAMPDGGRLEVHCSRWTPAASKAPPVSGMAGGGWAVLRITDTGGGIPAEALPHIFEPFFTTKPHGFGTGLGLAQVYGIVEQHGGLIEVESPAGAGAIFTVCLPLLPEDARLPDALEPEEAPEGSGELILLVEDDDLVREVGRDLLESLGYRTLTAGNGEEALWVLEARHREIALVLTDLVMPVMGGLQMIEVLRARRHEVKIVAFSGYPLSESRKAVVRAGPAACLKKPLSRPELARALHEALHG